MADKIIYEKEKYFENIKNYYKQNYMELFVLAGTSLVIGHFSDQRYLVAMITILVATWQTWAMHYTMHSDNPLAHLHEYLHHSSISKQFWAISVEALLELLTISGGWMLAIILLIKHKFGFYLLNPYIILFWGISFILVHLIQFHNPNVWDNTNHAFHHDDLKTNMSPDYWDIIFKTKYDKSPIVHQTTWPLLTILTIVIVPFIHSKYDFISSLSNSKAP